MTLKLIVLSDKMLGGVSAYSQQTYELCTRFVTLGHKVAHIPMNRANRMGKMVEKGVLIFDSSSIDPMGEDVAVDYYLQFKADMLITNKEPWNFSWIYKQAINFVPMAIIDHSPVSTLITDKLRTAFRVIAISRHAQRELMKSNIESVYIPNAVRTDLFKPLDKAKCKKMWYLDPDDFVIGIVAMNRARKMIPRMLRGYKRFLELNPDVKAHLFLWTNVFPSARPVDELTTGVADVGVNLVSEIYQLGLGEPPNDVRWVKWDDIARMGGIPIRDEGGGWDMASLYNAFDVNLLCSGGEGAGYPYLEAAACGVGSIGTDYAAAPEYIGPGLLVKANDYVIINTPGTRYYLADIDEMANALTKFYNADREKIAVKAREFAERYSYERVIEKLWKPFFEQCEPELFPRLTKGTLGRWNNG